MKRRIAVLGNGWAFEFSNSILEGIKKASDGIDTDVFYFTCYRFHNPDKSINTTGYRCFDFIDYTQFDGIILLSNLFEDDQALYKVSEKIKQLKIPAVSLVRKIDGFSFIHVDNFIGYYQLINHLIEKHNVKKLAFVGGIKNDVQSEERYNAYKKALAEHNLPEDEHFVVRNTDWSFKAGYEEGLKLFSDRNNFPDAVVCSNDVIAFGVIRAAYDYNLMIPKDVKIVGFDNLKMAERALPSLSTVNTNSEEMGIKAVELLFSKDREIKDITINSEPVFRQTCGCASELTHEQHLHSIKSLLVQDEEERFSTHLRHTEGIFINDDNFHMFWEGCQNFFVTRHEFEGDNFAIMVKKDLVNSIIYDGYEYNDSVKNCDLQVLVNIKDGKKLKPSVIKTGELMPPELEAEGSNIFLIIPLVYKENVYGYYIARNNLKLLFNKRGYTWAKNFANSIEKFREKTKYLMLSQKYLALSTTDTLTGIYNRAAIGLFGNDLYETNRHSDLYTVIIFIDLNYLKVINDKHGHLHGDLAIKIVAEEIKKCIPEKWLPIRYGGDEFVVLGTSRSKENVYLLQNLNELLEKKRIEMSLPYELTASIGATVVPPDSYNSLAKEIDMADNIMYQNKQSFHEKHDAQMKQKDN